MDSLVLKFILKGVAPLSAFLKYDEDGYPIEEAHFESFLEEDEEDDDDELDSEEELISNEEWA